MTTTTIHVGALARVEGEGSLTLTHAGGKITEVAFGIFEPPRFFEAFLRGRRMEEAVDITARICGICPIAYQMSAAQAMERIVGIEVDGVLRDLRRLIYCGEWIESHALHVFMLHLPDFLGYQSAIHMAADHADLVKKALRLKKIGNDVMRIVGGREIHPVNNRVGGFYKAPSRSALTALAGELAWGRAFAEEAVAFLGGLSFPDLTTAYRCVALACDDEYAIDRGRIVGDGGLDIDVADYEAHFAERHVKRSNALHSVTLPDETPYLVGPVARYNLNRAKLSPTARAAAERAGLPERVTNPFMSIVVRGVELLYALEEAERIVAGYRPPKTATIPYEVRAGRGAGCTEAPRGICWHRYDVDADGIITDARIVPPTSQNQLSIEEDLRRFAEPRLGWEKEKLTRGLEQTIRNYDPCISCATHFLDLTIREAP